MARLNQIHRKLDWHLRRNTNKLRQAVRAWFASTIKRITDDLTRKYIKDRVSDLTDWAMIEEEGKSFLKPIVLDTFLAGKTAAYGVIGFHGAFDVLNVEAVKRAEAICAKLITEVTNETKKAIRTRIAAGIKEGLSMGKIARELRDVVGLTERQASAVANFKSWLQTKYPDMSEIDAGRKIKIYSIDLHNYRTNTIARTETARAQSMGYVDGLQDTGVKLVEFSPYPGCCEACAAMDGETYKLEEAGQVIPVHPNCRCVLLPVVEEEALTSEAIKPSEELECPD